MALEHPNARIARGIWDAASRADVDELLRLYAPDLRLYMHGDGQYPPVTKGVYAVLDETAAMAESVDDMRLELQDVYASDQGAVLRYRSYARRGEQLLNAEYLYLLRIENERAVEARLVPLDRTHHDAFWAKSYSSAPDASTASS
jgi:ketosteroid isomerase-like protein